MSEQRDQDWAELEARAHRLLEHAKEVEPRDEIRRYGSLLRLWHSPAFGALKSWTLLTPGRKCHPGAEPCVREVAWDRSTDHQRIYELPAKTNAAPTIILREAGLSLAELNRLLAAGSDLTVPIVGISHSVGVDGEYFGVETYEVSPSIRLQWWCAGPLEWRHFTDWIAQIRLTLQDRLEQECQP